MSFFKKKSIAMARESIHHSGLKRTLTAFDLLLFGLGSIVGSGVFVLTGIVAAKYSGPAVMLSYVIAGMTCVLVALGYAELASMIPTSGSIYTYTYVAFGELLAWFMACALILELAVSGAVVAAAWSGYIISIFETAGLQIPEYLTKIPSEGGVINLPAVLIVFFVGYMLFLGTQESKRLNAFLVTAKIIAIFLFVMFAAPHFDATRWENFMPYGPHNVVVGASILFFSYAGFSTLAAAAEECKNPKRDIIIGIVGAVIGATIIYVIVGGLATGIADYDSLNNSRPLASALKSHGNNVGAAVIAAGAVMGMTSVIMMNLYGVTRVFYVVARDGLIPKKFNILHKKHHSPYLTIIAFTILLAVLAGFCPLEATAKLSSMASLIDYTMVMIIVMFLRYTMPNEKRTFICPAIYIIGPIGVLATLYLLLSQIITPEFTITDSGFHMAIYYSCMFIVYLLIKKSQKRQG